MIRTQKSDKYRKYPHFLSDNEDFVRHIYNGRKVVVK